MGLHREGEWVRRSKGRGRQVEYRVAYSRLWVPPAVWVCMLARGCGALPYFRFSGGMFSGSKSAWS